jgi:hypothetical protein
MMEIRLFPAARTLCDTPTIVKPRLSEPRRAYVESAARRKSSMPATAKKCAADALTRVKKAPLFRSISLLCVPISRQGGDRSDYKSYDTMITDGENDAVDDGPAHCECFDGRWGA